MSLENTMVYYGPIGVVERGVEMVRLIKLCQKWLV